jgi:hypothetical protein
LTWAYLYFKTPREGSSIWYQAGSAVGVGVAVWVGGMVAVGVREGVAVSVRVAVGLGVWVTPHADNARVNRRRDR